jgi:HEPN domain-containing protein
MTKDQIKEITEYWVKTSKHDHETMHSLFEIKRYSDSLFFGHLALEKILKANFVKNNSKSAPRIHDLARLSQLAKIKSTDEDLATLKDINNFNIAARYPDYKLKFYKLCTKTFTEKYVSTIDKIFKTLCQNLKLKK